MSQISFEPIGYLETCFKERFGTPRQPGLVPSSWGVLRLRPELNLQDGLDGLSEFSHVWLVFVFHQNANKGIHTKIHPPRLEGEKIGLFSTRTPHRPNPIGLSAVKLEKIEGHALYLSGVDILDGSPILDIKPYIKTTDSIPEATAGWTVGKPERTIEVSFSLEADLEISNLLGTDALRTKKSLVELLQLDPRPVFYRGSAENPNPYTDVYGFRFDNINVTYKMLGSSATILSVQRWAEFQKSNSKKS